MSYYRNTNNRGTWDTVNSDDFGVWDGQLGTPTSVQTSGYRQPNIGLPNPFDGPSFVDQRGRRCRVVCDPPHRPNPRPRPPQLIGLTLLRAQQLYPYLTIRVVIADGQRLPVTLDHRADRINVETRGGVIVRIVGYY